MNQKQIRAAVEAMLFASGDPIGADKLFGGEIGQQQRACNDKARQASTRQKLSVCGCLIVTFCLHIGDDSNQNGKCNKCNQCKCHSFTFPLLYSLSHTLQIKSSLLSTRAFLFALL